MKLSWLDSTDRCPEQRTMQFHSQPVMDVAIHQPEMDMGVARPLGMMTKKGLKTGH